MGTPISARLVPAGADRVHGGVEPRSVGFTPLTFSPRFVAPFICLGPIQTAMARTRHLSLLNALDLAAQEANHDGWDGYEGVALDRRNYERARQILLRLPSRFPPPEVDADPRGGVILSWDPAPGIGFVVSIRDSNLFTYAGIRDDASVQGREFGVDELPQVIIDELERMIAPGAGSK